MFLRILKIRQRNKITNTILKGLGAVLQPSILNTTAAKFGNQSETVFTARLPMILQILQLAKIMEGFRLINVTKHQHQ